MLTAVTILWQMMGRSKSVLRILFFFVTKKLQTANRKTRTMDTEGSDKGELGENFAKPTLCMGRFLWPARRTPVTSAPRRWWCASSSAGTLPNSAATPPLPTAVGTWGGAAGICPSARSPPSRVRLPRSSCWRRSPRTSWRRFTPPAGSTAGNMRRSSGGQLDPDPLLKRLHHSCVWILWQPLQRPPHLWGREGCAQICLQQLPETFRTFALFFSFQLRVCQR